MGQHKNLPLLPQRGSSLCRCLESSSKMVCLWVASSIPASFSSPSVTFSKPWGETVYQVLADRQNEIMWHLGRLNTRAKYWRAQWTCTYLQTVVSSLQYLCVLGQAILFQPPGNGAIIHVWTVGREELRTAYLAHMLVHVFQLESQIDIQMEDSLVVPDLKTNWLVWPPAAGVCGTDLWTGSTVALRTAESLFILALASSYALIFHFLTVDTSLQTTTHLICNHFNYIYLVYTLSERPRRKSPPTSSQKPAVAPRGPIREQGGSAAPPGNHKSQLGKLALSVGGRRARVEACRVTFKTSGRRGEVKSCQHVKSGKVCRRRVGPPLERLFYTDI